MMFPPPVPTVPRKQTTCLLSPLLTPLASSQRMQNRTTFPHRASTTSRTPTPTRASLRRTPSVTGPTSHQTRRRSPDPEPTHPRECG
uniref:Uncharacterized protein n=1 Tax=Ixodes scapularis TaxID=6945 RepID=A0A4D5RAH6_IXOSC